MAELCHSKLRQKWRPGRFFDFGLKIVLEAKIKSTSCVICEIHVYIDFESFRQIHGKLQEEQGFWTKWHFEIWSFWCFLEDKVINLGTIDLQIGLPPNIKVIDGQNEFEVHISKTMAKIASFQPKILIGQDATFAPNLNGHNSAIFCPLLISHHAKMISSSRRIEYIKKLSSIFILSVFGY